MKVAGRKIEERSLRLLLNDYESDWKKDRRKSS